MTCVYLGSVSAKKSPESQFTAVCIKSVFRIVRVMSGYSPYFSNVRVKWWCKESSISKASSSMDCKPISPEAHLSRKAEESTPIPAPGSSKRQSSRTFRTNKLAIYRAIPTGVKNWPSCDFLPGTATFGAVDLDCSISGSKDISFVKMMATGRTGECMTRCQL